MSGRVCAVPDCDSAHSAKSFCHKHYLRWRTHGDPLVFKGTEIGAARDYFESVVLQYEGNDCLIWPYTRVKGYGSIKRGGKDSRVHRLACEEQNGPPPTPKHDAAHSCGKGHLGCVTKKHLSWKTRAENMADTVLHGTHNKGEKHPKAKITEAQAREILSMKGIELQRDIAKRLGTTRHTVAEIHAGRNWRHLSIQQTNNSEEYPMPFIMLNAFWFWSLMAEAAIADLEVATGRRKAFVLIQGGKSR